ncbi:MAG: 50S ribosomal protein L3 N(5)-glutamine methyltransferase [Pseudohongiellaceae bacterium]
MNTQQCIERIHRELEKHDLCYGHGTDNAWDEACWLLAAVRFPDSLARELDPDQAVSDAELAKARTILTQRIQLKKPLAYLLREAWFANLRFYVDERVLVPRSPVAELIQQDFAPLLKQAPARILDLCTGSGCIGIACAYAFPEAQVVISDLSAQALEVARINVDQHGLQNRVRAVQSDLFTALDRPFDLIVCNPPYVSGDEYASLPHEYHSEPELGLVSADEGLALPLAIVRQAGDYLAETGLLILETGNSWQALAQALPEVPLLWLEFAHGGHGVCAVYGKDLQNLPADKSSL